MPVHENAFRWALGALMGMGFALSAWHRIRADRAGGRISRRHDGALVVTLLVTSGLAATAGLLAYLVNPAWMRWSQLDLPPWLRLEGIPLGVAALLLFAWIFRTLGGNVTATAQARENATLVTHGPYRYVRHPMYMTGLLLFLSFFLLTANWFIAVMCGADVAVLAARTTQEEANLVARFGDRYREYMRRTGRFLPRR
jgi:protein-S-isoprenylcysteine O-methyltransferase Ste14